MSDVRQVEARSGVGYAGHDGVSLLGDLYLPAGAGRHPVLVAVHGGGWQAGARSSFQHWGPYLAERGYALFAISYRLAKKGESMCESGGWPQKGGRPGASHDRKRLYRCGKLI
jgi:acetyl esterase/lipase